MDQQLEQLAGKTVLVIGGGSIGRRFIWKTLHDLRLKIILIDEHEKIHVKDYIHSFLKYDYLEGSITDDELHAEKIIQLLGDKIKKLSACFTYDDYSTHIVAIVCEKLGLVGTTPFAAKTAKSKKDTYDSISKEHVNSSPDRIVILPAVSLRVDKEEDILNADGLSYPAILKPDHGSFSNGVTEVFSVPDCITKYRNLQQSFGIEWFAGKYGSSMVLMEFLHGILYQVDLIIFEGNLLKGIVCVMGPKFRDLGGTFQNAFSDTTMCFSSCLSQQNEDDLIMASFRCCQKIGLNNGVYQLETILTDSGYRLLEINGRPGSYRRGSVLKVTHGIDLFVTQALISCGIKPILPDVRNTFAAGCYLYSFIHREQLSKVETTAKIQALLKNNDILYILRAESLVEKEDACPKPHANIVALDKKNLNAATLKLIQILNNLELSNEEFNIEKMTEIFL